MGASLSDDTGGTLLLAAGAGAGFRFVADAAAETLTESRVDRRAGTLTLSETEA